MRAQNAIEGDFSVSQAEMSSRQAMLENASDIKVPLHSLSCFTSLLHSMSEHLTNFKATWEKNNSNVFLLVCVYFYFCLLEEHHY